MIGNIFHTFFYQPLFNALIFLYELIPGGDFGLAIILLTLLIRALLFPLNAKSIRSQKAISDLEPKLQAIRKKFEGNKEKIAKETMRIYQEAKINPFSGLVLVLIQLPILIALYRVFTKSVFVEELQYLYSFISRPQEIKPNFLMTDLSQPNALLAAGAGILQFLQTKMQSSSSKKAKTETGNQSDFSQVLQKQMLYFFPAFTFLILLRIPSAISLYLAASAIFSILQIFYVQKKEIRKNKKED